ncbi:MULTISPECIES: C1 family peptidase [Flavobacteriaceae]|uniref:C1 family peptidase n=1 Tax=Flavobacteriaceae TaxID=49546 RepID=UPI001491454C|nr:MULTISPECIES: C1 family peptidase [Allomuricauda]MDC6367233.1 C1 family peptidase [Muricauda sp. AC10]
MEEIDLSNYCPNSISQYRATCYAYAVVYTALSAEFNIRNNISDRELINKNYFSSGIVASKNNSNLPLFKKSPYCGRSGTAKKSLDILKSTGTVFSNEYDCNCKSFSKIKRRVPRNTKWHKISGYSKLEINNKMSEDKKNWIISALIEKHPVIIGLYQNSFFKNIKTEFSTEEFLDEETNRIITSNSGGTSNHVVCIVGYNSQYRDDREYFLVKNNYTTWGINNGYSWIPATFLMPLIHESYFIEGIVE